MWKKIAYKSVIWLTGEVWLNMIGLDNFADYSEFLFAQDLELKVKNRRTVKINEYPPQFCHKIDDLCPIPGTVIKPKDLEEEGDKTQVEVLKNKCQQLEKPCIKVICLKNIGILENN